MEYGKSVLSDLQFLLQSCSLYLFIHEISNLQRFGMLLVVILLLSVCVNSLALSLQVDYALIASQAGATLNNLLSHAQELVSKLRSLQLDQREFVCLKFLVLFSLGEYRERGGGVERSGHHPNLTCSLPRFLLDLEISHKTAFTSPCTIRPSL